MPSARLTFSRTTAALCLWQFGEDELVPSVLSMSPAELRAVQALALTYDDQSHELPVDGRASNGHVIALAAVTRLEGQLRPLRRNRRRPARETPESLTVADHD